MILSFSVHCQDPSIITAATLSKEEEQGKCHIELAMEKQAVVDIVNSEAYQAFPGSCLTVRHVHLWHLLTRKSVPTPYQLLHHHIRATSKHPLLYSIAINDHFLKLKFPLPSPYPTHSHLCVIVILHDTNPLSQKTIKMIGATSKVHRYMRNFEGSFTFLPLLVCSSALICPLSSFACEAAVICPFWATSAEVQSGFGIPLL